MKKQLQGLAWILFGILLAILIQGPFAPMYVGVSLLCGVIGLVLVICYSGPDK